METFLLKRMESQPGWAAENAERIKDRLPLVKGFLDMTTTYVLSREWQDLLSIYMFRLHPLPHCSERKVGYSFFGFVARSNFDDRPGCSAEQDASTQAAFALGLLLVAAAVQGMTTKFTADHPHIHEQVTSIIGMCVGWGAGDAVIKLLLELHPPSATKEAIAKAAKAAADAAAKAAAAEAARASVAGVGAADGSGSSKGGGSISSEALRRLLSSSAAASSHTDQYVFVADESLDRILFALCYSVLACLSITLLHPLVTSGAQWDQDKSGADDDGQEGAGRSSGRDTGHYTYSWVCQPLRLLRRLRCRGSARDAMVEMTFALWSLTTRALTTSVLMLWTYVSATNLVEGLRPEQRGSGLHWRLLVLWALVLTLVGAVVTVKSLRLRETIETERKRQAHEHGVWSPLAEGDDDVHGQRTRGEREEGEREEGEREEGEMARRETERSAREQHDGRKQVQHTDQPPTAAASFLAATPTAVPPIESSSEPRTSPALPSSILAITPRETSLAACSDAWWRQEALIASSQVLLLVEKVMAWMAGCAWTDVFFANSAPDPSGWLAAKDGAVALMLTGLAVAWMVMHGDLNEAALGMERSVRSGKRIDRSHVENHFVVYSASFFVGWSWVVLLRDLAAVSGQARIRPVSGDYLGGVAHLLGFDTVQNVRAAEYNAFARSLLGVIVFGPVLTVLTIYLKGVALRVYGRAGGTRSLIALGKLYAKARDEDAEIETRYAPKARALRRSGSSSTSLLEAAGLVGSSGASVAVADEATDEASAERSKETTTQDAITNTDGASAAPPTSPLPSPPPTSSSPPNHRSDTFFGRVARLVPRPHVRAGGPASSEALIS